MVMVADVLFYLLLVRELCHRCRDVFVAAWVELCQLVMMWSSRGRRCWFDVITCRPAARQSTLSGLFSIETIVPRSCSLQQEVTAMLVEKLKLSYRRGFITGVLVMSEFTDLARASRLFQHCFPLRP
jgi:hypothetical protein